MTSNRLTVAVPVHNAPGVTADCLEALARHSEGADVLIIDDGSTDPAVTEVLDPYRGRTGWQIVRQSNRGFVATANRIFSETGGDVVLLNSDTLVTSGWLEALDGCRRSTPDLATATPWSNNAEICSLPNFCENNPVPQDLDGLAECLRRAGAPTYPELPTGVGFCMLVTRAALDRLGGFDEQTFGLGYGEENDFCRRAAEAGMRNVLCDDAYVAHVGNQSFGPRGLSAGPEAMGRLLAKHPGYEALVHAFIAQDPLAGRRREILDHCCKLF